MQCFFKDAVQVFEQEEEDSVFNTKLAQSFGHVFGNSVEFTDVHKVVIQVDSLDMCLLGRLALPSFVDELHKKLNISSQEELIVIPFSESVLYATRSGTPLGCCMLGDFADAFNTVHNTPSWCTSAPYRVRSVDRTSPELELVGRGIVPVLWEVYPFWGQEPTSALVMDDRLVRFPIPHSTEQANAFLDKLGNGFQPSAVEIKRHSTDKGSVGPCAACFSWDCILEPCACGQVAYCDQSHAEAHRDLHSLVCTAV